MTSYLYIPSFPSLYMAFYLSNSETSIHVITPNSSVAKVLQDSNIPYTLFNENIKPYHYSQTRKELNNILNSLSPQSDFYLFDNTFATSGFYLAAHWNKGQVYYNNLCSSFSIAQEPFPIRNRIIKKLVECTLYLNLIFRKRSNEFVLGIGDDFIRKHKIEAYRLPLPYAEIKSQVIKHMQVGGRNTRNLWIDQGTLNNIVNEESYHQVLDIIVNKKECNIKAHPRHKSIYNFGKSYQYPSYIPSEFLLSCVNHAVISVYSLTLIEASQYTKAISILELVTWNNNEYKQQTKDMLRKQSNNKILFPSSIDELKALL